MAGLLITWLTVPGFFLIVFAFTYLPHLLRIAFSRAVRSAIMESVGASSIKEVDLSSYLFEQIFGAIPTFVIVLICIPLVLLVLAWFGVCMVMTWRHFRYAIAVTDIRVIGRANGEEMDSPLSEVVDVFVERSLWGKLLGYGNIVVHTKRKTLTFRNIRKPYELHRLLMSYAQNYCAH